MNIFKLPDLGEGLPDAIIREWFVKPGDLVTLEQPLVAMETAKALVDVPSPIAGKVKTLHGKVGETINTNEPLVSFESDESSPIQTSKDQGTVVGKITESGVLLDECATGIQAKWCIDRPKIIPAYRALAQAFGIDIKSMSATGPNQTITTTDIKEAILNHLKINPTQILKSDQGEKLSPTYRAMVQSMTQSHQQIVPVTLCDDVDIQHWFKKQDLTIRLIQAICQTCQTEPRLNAQFFPGNEKFWQRKEINIGIAIDSEKNGLFVPVLKNANKLNEKQLRQKLEEFKQKADSKTFTSDDLKDATILLSNFGSIAGRYGIPVLTPPCVTIIGAGRVADKVVCDKKKIVVHSVLSIAITADHRVITGGELARFLQTLLSELS